MLCLVIPGTQSILVRIQIKFDIGHKENRIKIVKPRIGNFYGMKVTPVIVDKTWIEGEMWCTDYGQFRRRALVYHKDTDQLVSCKADVPDTFFSIPAYTKTEHGFITCREEPDTNKPTGFVFNPDKDQSQSVKDWKKEYKKCYR